MTNVRLVCWPPFIMQEVQKKRGQQTNLTFVMNQLLVKSNTHTGYLYYVEVA